MVESGQGSRNPQHPSANRIVEVAALAGVSEATVSRALRDMPTVAPATRARVKEAALLLGYAPLSTSGRSREARDLSPNRIFEVAALAGVSEATVSRALRDMPTVAPATRARVKAAAAQLGYVPSPSAMGLATGRTRAIGVLAPWVTRWFFCAVIDGAQQVLTKHGYDILLYPLSPDPSAERQQTDPPGIRSLYKRVDGVLALNVPLGLHSVNTLLTLRVPVVTIGSMIATVPAVLVDNVEVGRIATNHLLDLGHRHIAFLGRDPDEAFGFTVAADRRAGHREALVSAGITPQPEYCQTTGFSTEGGERGFHRLWSALNGSALPAPTAIFAVSDEVAMGVIYAARRLGLRVPEDVSVIGVDNHDLSYLFELTTVAQPVREQGRLAAQMLLDQLAEPGPTPAGTVEPELIKRKTTRRLDPQSRRYQLRDTGLVH